LSYDRRIYQVGTFISHQRETFIRLIGLSTIKIVVRHVIQVLIEFDQDPQVYSIFWRKLLARSETKLNMCTMYHPQTYGQSK
jgi:hypothetical protein